MINFVDYYRPLFLSFILLINYNVFAEDGCSTDYSSGQVTVGNGNLTFEDNCQIFLESALTFTNDRSSRTITIGSPIESTTVLIEASEVVLDAESNERLLELIIEKEDTLVIIGDLVLYNYSTITVKEEGVLIVDGSIITQGGEGNYEPSSLVNINIETGGEIHINNDAILNYASGNIEGLIFVPNGNLVTYTQEFKDNDAPWWLWLIYFLTPDSDLKDIVKDTIDQIENQGTIGDIDLDKIKEEYPQNVHNPFIKDYTIDVEFPLSANGLNFFDETGVYTQSIFTESNLADIISGGNILSLLDKEVVFTVQSVEDKDCLLFSSYEVNSIGSLKEALSEMTWKLPSTIETEIEKRNDGQESDNEMILDYFQNKTIKIEVVNAGTVTDRILVDTNLGGSNTRITATTAEKSSEEILVDFASQVPDDLPVELTYFRSQIKEDEVHLEWETASEINASHFEVQRSLNRKNWNTIGNVEASGNSQTAIKYTFIDDAPLSMAYYRLKQVDFDEVYEFFGPISVKLEEMEETLSLLIMPNVVSSGETIQFSFAGLNTGTSINLQVYNSNGYLVYEEVIEDINTTNLLKSMQFTQQLISGMYYVVVKSGKDIVKEKLLIN
ncbi:T9SS type A sorting domain-containing protein [Flammeovirga sp. EKP202]|uniref:T9SS type A sorting domain-containing protein n=1 Tax=Flammeovirga sp. EKP202 TaxID=2770592 RepID=UPI00165FAF10|nr:T9SS type A sorting domain-containing protein [Flammeovirga sp. EKP202]MBD0399920.1 T9SS type A sorting domain-containing protein [Flammeovirga sp. EKP202]